MESPKHSLEQVKELIKNVKEHYFTMSAKNCVISHFEITVVEAQSFILMETLKLVEANFSHRKLINHIPYDIYGKRISDIPWYIKFAICEDDNGKFIHYISFHPTKHELKTQIEILEKHSS